VDRPVHSFMQRMFRGQGRGGGRVRGRRDPALDCTEAQQPAADDASAAWREEQSEAQLEQQAAADAAEESVLMAVTTAGSQIGVGFI